jgi:hypothetical protein
MCPASYAPVRDNGGMNNGARQAEVTEDYAGDEHCNWCQRGGEMQSFGGRLFCGEDCANSWCWEWGCDT